MEKQYIILEPGLTYLKKEQVVTQSYLNKAKKVFTYKKLSRKVVIANGKL